MKNDRESVKGNFNLWTAAKVSAVLVGATIFNAGCDTSGESIQESPTISAGQSPDLLNFPPRATCYDVTQQLSSAADQETNITIYKDRYALFTNPLTSTRERLNLIIGVIYEDPENISDEQFEADVSEMETELDTALEITNVKEEGGFIRIYHKAKKVEGEIEFDTRIKGIKKGDLDDDNIGCTPAYEIAEEITSQ
ncbi:MAG: hypothetical protein AAB895_02915 [Patescibacteria group bacterium]